MEKWGLEVEINNRLAALVDYIPSGSIVADIGTDHACLPIYLIKTGICPRVIATEIHDGPYEIARLAISIFNLQGKIDLRKGDGLKVLLPGEAKMLVLAGMGGNNIYELLAAVPEVTQVASRLILQPMIKAGELRLWLVNQGWRLVDESLVEEKRRLYQVIVTEKGEEKAKNDPFLLETGPRLVEKKDPLLPIHLKFLITRYQKIVIALEKSNSLEAKNKVEQIVIKIARWKWLSDFIANTN